MRAPQRSPEVEMNGKRERERSPVRIREMLQRLRSFPVFYSLITHIAFRAFAYRGAVFMEQAGPAGRARSSHTAHMHDDVNRETLSLRSCAVRSTAATLSCIIKFFR